LAPGDEPAAIAARFAGAGPDTVGTLQPACWRAKDFVPDTDTAPDADPGTLTSVFRRAARGRLPNRYTDFWRAAFDQRVSDAVAPGQRILDIGSGRKPTIPVEQRPPGCVYVGLDLSMAELEAAPPGSYDRMIVADVTQRVPELEGQFDLALSFQVFEHVKPIDVALLNVRSYLRPGGRALMHLSGGRSVFGLLNRILPQRLGVALLSRLVGRDPKTVFPAHYDRCWYTALRQLATGWSTFHVVPRWRGASYFGFSRLVRAIYVTYEEWTIRAGRLNLAPYYLIDARA
jgi:SAM-dependent methyltransferase